MGQEMFERLLSRRAVAIDIGHINVALREAFLKGSVHLERGGSAAMQGTAVAKGGLVRDGWGLRDRGNSLGTNDSLEWGYGDSVVRIDGG